MKNLITRTITGIVFVGAVIGSILAGTLPFVVLFGIFTLIGLWEFFTLLTTETTQPHKIVSTLLGIFAYILLHLSFCNPTGSVYISFLIPALFALFVFELFRNKKNPFQNIASTVLGIVYVVLPMLLLSLFSIDREKQNILLAFFIILWTNDTAAYCVGSLIGKHRLFERLSPKKSWEGSLGGLLISLVAAWICSLYFSEFTLLQWLGFALVTVVFGTLGDLVESMLKRSVRVKDSGNILPGHGGILDRFDAALLAAPFVFTYLLLIH